MKEDQVIVLILKGILTRWKEEAGLAGDDVEQIQHAVGAVDESAVAFNATPKVEDDLKVADDLDVTLDMGGAFAQKLQERENAPVQNPTQVDENDMLEPTEFLQNTQKSADDMDLMETVILRSDDKKE
jgi:hypothetical protein